MWSDKNWPTLSHRRYGENGFLGRIGTWRRKMVNIIKIIRLEYFYNIGLLLIILAAVVIPGPIILGNWESLYFYHTFGAFDSQLDFEVSPRANIGDPGHGFVDVARNIIDFFNLSLTSENFRIPAILYGAFSIIVFFVVIKRYFSLLPALISTALLSANPMFHQQMNSMTVLIVSGLGFLLLIERLQALEFKYLSNVQWIGLSFALVIVALHYGVGRIYSVIFLTYWLVKIIWIQWKNTKSFELSSMVIRRLFSSITFSFFFLIALDINNLKILNIKEFLFPHVSEIVLLNDIRSLGVIETIFFNGRILVESLLIGGGDFHSRYPSYRLADYRFPLLNSFILPFALMGFMVSLLRVAQRPLLFSMPYLTGLFLLVLTLLPQLFSSVFIITGPDEITEFKSGTLSNHRLFYAVFACYFMVAVSFSWIIEKVGKNLQAKLVIISLALLTYLFSIYGLLSENIRFRTQIADINPSLSSSFAYPQWADGGQNADRPSATFSSHLQQHAQYYRLAQTISTQVAALSQPATVTLVYAPARLFSESLLVPNSLPYIHSLNFHSVFLALYLNDQGLRAAWVQMLDNSRSVRHIGFSRPKEYSAPLLLNADGELVYRRPDNIFGLVRFHGAAANLSAIIATTIEEFQFAKQWLDNRSVVYKEVRIKQF